MFIESFQVTLVPESQSPIRTVHHLAASGGTLISKCIASMNNVILASEISPSGRPPVRWNPIGLITQLHASYPNLLTLEDLQEHFLNQVQLSVKICVREKKDLVIRCHDNLLFNQSKTPFSSPLIEWLKGYNVLSLVTVRDPIDNFLSASKRNWAGGVGNSITQYCNKYHEFLDCYSLAPILKYEDLCISPDSFMIKLCNYLNLEYNPSFLSEYRVHRFTGDSGEGSKLLMPTLPAPKGLPSPIREEAMNSSAVHALYKRLGYDISHRLSLGLPEKSIDGASTV